MKPTVRFEVSYLGHVQGVGFRATVSHLARGWDVSGFVRNEPDGCVAMVVEGELSEVQGLMNEVAEAMSGRIRETRVDQTVSTGEFSRFEVRYR